jgi:hypothetical protein
VVPPSEVVSSTVFVEPFWDKVPASKQLVADVQAREVIVTFCDHARLMGVDHVAPPLSVSDHRLPPENGLVSTAAQLSAPKQLRTLIPVAAVGADVAETAVALAA